MSRGGWRGRGRGGGNNTARDAFNAAFAGMSKEDSRAVFESFSRPTKGSGMMYPPLDKAAELPGPTELESSIVSHSIAFGRDLADGQAGEHGKRDGAPWRLASERKVIGVEIESYSDRYRRQAPATTGGSGTTILSVEKLHMYQDLFPPALWSEYFEGVSNDGRAGEAARARKRRRVLEGDDEEGEEEEEGDEDVDDDFDFSDASDDHQDYDHNYFDNGEGDDDSAGEGGEDEGGRYDD